MIGSRTNPILWREWTYLTRGAPRANRREFLFGMLVVTILVWSAVALALRFGDYGALATQFALFALWGLTAVASARAIIAGANAISREHVGGTWDSLVLTGISARRILFGKWLAATRRVAGWAVLLGILRMTMLPVFMVAITQRFAWRQYWRYGGSYDAYDTSISWVPWASFAAVALAALLPFLEIAAGTALGIVASAITRRGIPAAVLALTVRFFPIAMFAGFTRLEVGAAFWRWWRFSPFSLADSGTTILMRLASPDLLWTRGTHFWSLQTMILPLGLLACFVAAGLYITLVLARTRGALPHPQRQPVQA